VKFKKRTLKALQRNKFLLLAKVSLVDEKLSTEKVQSLQQLISKANHHKNLKEMKIKDKQEKLKQEKAKPNWKKRI